MRARAEGPKVRNSRLRGRKRRRTKSTVLDLFSGAGGTAVGFRRAGFQIIGAVEIDDSAADTYERNIRITVHREDIRELEPAVLRKKLKLEKRELDVMVGCPPCQGFTRLRNSNGRGDPRNSLVIRYLDYVREFNPRFAVFENVPGLLRTRHGKIFFTRLKTGLRSLGYKLANYEVNAADYGVPQHRVRVILIASRRGVPPAFRRPSHGAPTSDDVRKGRRKPWVTARDAIGNGRLQPVRAGTQPRHGDSNHLPAGTGDDVLRFLKRVPRNGGSRRDVRKNYWLACHRDHEGHYDTYGRLAWDAPANTITSGCTNPSKGRFVHPTQSRALTIREAALLQGFPFRYRFVGGSKAEQVGNAVPPPLACAVARTIRAGLDNR